MVDAVKEADVKPEQIEYVNAHGTSTHHNDLFETRAVKVAFGDAASNLKIDSYKVYDWTSARSSRSRYNLLSV